MSDDGILRCQVRVIGGDSYTSCGAEATNFEIRRGGGDLREKDYAFLACRDHASPTAKEIGMKSVPELRSHVEFRGVEPAF